MPFSFEYVQRKILGVFISRIDSLCVLLALPQDGHTTLFALFDAVDDTVLMNKSIIAPLLKDVDEIGLDKFGAKVLLYLLAPREPKYFNQELRTFLASGDANPHSKKEASVRQAELRAPIVAPLANVRVVLPTANNRCFYFFFLCVGGYINVRIETHMHV